MAKPQTLAEYLDGFDGPGRELLDQLCALADDAVPEATHAIKWSSPAWVHPSGTILFMVSGHTKHVSVAFTPSTREAFDAELGELAMGKSTVKIPHGQAVPAELLRRMFTFRVREHEDDGVLWM